MQSSHDKDDMRKFGICPYQFITPAIQWLVSCYDRVLLAHLVWYGMVFIYSTSLYIIYIAHHYNITQDAEREMHEVQYLYVAFP